eukprot:TRINITY_DN938_c0_g1_i1.p1 TRINITY_DN938_c0_g1~~TRINITY_DN938_c0_g1_i1.p1  ORF type:complete len:322 (+),score=87.47 TRINITY_DN938_c0_g1_i1:152-1117(+)
MADASVLVIFCLANLTVMYGAYRSLPSHLTGGRYDDDSEGQEFKTKSALLFVVGASAGLMLMFYFMDTLSKIMLVIVSIVSCLSLIFLVEPYLERCLPDSVLRAECVVPVLGSLNCLTLIELPIGVGIVVLWLVGRDTWALAWVLNDILAFSICILIIASIRITNLKVASVLLLAVLGYDVFWVYLSPMLFHQNVMLRVTQGVDLPIKIDIPYFRGLGHSTIGLGDLVLPGLFSAFLLRFDRGRNDVNDTYFTTFSVAYALGLATCLLCAVILDAPQPAMLYLSPTTLLFVCIQAQCRREVAMLCHGNSDYEVIVDDEIML